MFAGTDVTATQLNAMVDIAQALAPYWRPLLASAIDNNDDDDDDNSGSNNSNNKDKDKKHIPVMFAAPFWALAAAVLRAGGEANRAPTLAIAVSSSSRAVGVDAKVCTEIGGC